MQINDFLENSARLFPEKQAVWFKGKWKTYAQIDAMANRLANYLISAGVVRGDRVAILYENSFEYIASYFAVLKAGCVTVALNTETTSESLVYVLNHAKAKAIVSQGKYVKFLLPAIQKTPELTHVIIEHKKPDNCIDPESSQKAGSLGEIFENGDQTQPTVKSIDIDLASIVYTSGSTGKPKGVMLTHQNIVNNTLSIVKYLSLTKDDRIMVVLPFRQESRRHDSKGTGKSPARLRVSS